MSILGLDLLAWVMLAYFALVTPFLGRRDLRALKRALDAGDTGARLRQYEHTMLFEWGAAILLGAVWWFLGRGVEPLGLVPQFGGWAIFWTALALGATAVFVRQSLRAAGDPDQRREIRGQLGMIESFAPHTGQELGRFSWLSLTAGICEEFLFRGLLMGMLAAAFGLWPAALLSSLVFGLAHAYQGPMGIVRTGAVGLVFALIVVLTGSLYVAILAHVAVDLAQGRMVHAAVSLDRSAVEAAPAAA